jgi:hypothetical protein
MGAGGLLSSGTDDAEDPLGGCARCLPVHSLLRAVPPSAAPRHLRTVRRHIVCTNMFYGSLTRGMQSALNGAASGLRGYVGVVGASIILPLL